jgi:erythromycin esterase
MRTPASLLAWLAERAEAFAPVADTTVPGLADDSSTVVGVGLVVRSARQLVLVSHAILATLVERAGFRADPTALAADSQSFLRMRETVELLEWLRSYAQAHPTDPVRVVHDQPQGHGRARWNNALPAATLTGTSDRAANRASGRRGARDRR